MPVFPRDAKGVSGFVQKYNDSIILWMQPSQEPQVTYTHNAYGHCLMLDIKESLPFLVWIFKLVILSIFVELPFEHLT